MKKKLDLSRLKNQKESILEKTLLIESVEHFEGLIGPINGELIFNFV